MTDAIITYERAENGDVKVRVGGTYTGRIKLAKGGGYYYLPLGQKQGGKVYPMSQQVKHSLEYGEPHPRRAGDGERG